jgi:anionic cell wall polymer biosynthesis LytR-Cps2A-Psr (LCP) family protein
MKGAHSNHNTVGQQFKSQSGYRGKKMIFIAILAFLFLSAVISILFSQKDKALSSRQFVSVGVCGCINNSAVYRLPMGADLATLIHTANGISSHGDIRNMNLNTILLNDSIYHIPRRKESILSYVDDQSLSEMHIKYPTHKERLINYLYIGFPAVYMLFQYSTEYQLINIIYIPHSTVFMDNDYRLIDIFFTLGIAPTVNILQNRMNQSIDYYFLQDKSSFIDMIDELGGIDLNIDAVFAEEYNMKKGWNLLDGWKTYEYIRFIDQKRHFSARKGSGSLESLELELKNIDLAYDQREFRQMKVIQALHKRFNAGGKDLSEVRPMISAILKKGNMETNVDLQAGADIFRLLMEGTEVSYGTLPGYYTQSGNNVYYIPEGPGYDMQRKQEVRELFQLNKESGSQTLF